MLRRYKRSKDLLFTTYDKLADSLFIFDNSNGNANLIALRDKGTNLETYNQSLFYQIFDQIEST